MGLFFFVVSSVSVVFVSSSPFVTVRGFPREERSFVFLARFGAPARSVFSAGEVVSFAFPPPRLRASHDARSVRSGPRSPRVGPLSSTGPTHPEGTLAMKRSTRSACSSCVKLSFRRGTRCAASFARCCCKTVFVACAIRAALCTAARSLSRAPTCSEEGSPEVVEVAQSVSTDLFASSSAAVMLSKSSSSASCSSSYACATLLTRAATAGSTTSSSAATCARYVAIRNVHRATSSPTSARLESQASGSTLAPEESAASATAPAAARRSRTSASNSSFSAPWKVAWNASIAEGEPAFGGDGGISPPEQCDASRVVARNHGK